MTKKTSIRELARMLTAAGRPMTEGGIRDAIKKGRVRANPSYEELVQDLQKNTLFMKGGNHTTLKTGIINIPPTISTDPPDMGIKAVPKERKQAPPEPIPQPEPQRRPPQQGQRVISSDLSGGDLQAVRLRRETIDAKKAELELAETMGKLADTDGMRRANQLSGRMVRESFEALPAKISGDLAALKNAKEVQVMLESKIREVLERIASAIG
jgi:hypothetical protein